MTMAFGEAERYVLGFFQKGKILNWNGEKHKIILSGKPAVSEGEPKTDIYILLSNGKKNSEIKISVKKENADFLENKMSEERAEQILGEDWKKVVESSTLKLNDKFHARPLIYKKRYRRTEAGAITLGWKFELLNKKSGELSDSLSLTRSQMIGVYAGTTLSDDKKNGKILGRVIENSGVANKILCGEIEKYKSAEKILEDLIPIGEYVDLYPKIYFACKALNYRTFKRKYDGNRPLAVSINWKVINGKLHPEYIFDKPLITRGNLVAENLVKSLDKLNISDTSNITEDNVSSLEYVHY